VKRNFLVVFIVIIALLQIVPIFSASKESKIESYIKIAHSSENRKAKSKMLDAIAKEFRSMKYSVEDETFINMLIFMTDEGSTRLEYNDKDEVINDYPEIRQKACRILGFIESESIKGALIGVLTNDKNIQVKTEAIKALGNIKGFVDIEILRAITFTYRSTQEPDPSFVVQMIEALRKLASINPTLKEDASNLLTEIQMGNFDRKIRTSAFKAIMELSK